MSNQGLSVTDAKGNVYKTNDWLKTPPKTFKSVSLPNNAVTAKQEKPSQKEEEIKKINIQAAKDLAGAYVENKTAEKNLPQTMAAYGLTGGEVDKAVKNLNIYYTAALEKINETKKQALQKAAQIKSIYNSAAKDNSISRSSWDNDAYLDKVYKSYLNNQTDLLKQQQQSDWDEILNKVYSARAQNLGEKMTHAQALQLLKDGYYSPYMTFVLDISDTAIKQYLEKRKSYN